MKMKNKYLCILVIIIIITVIILVQFLLQKWIKYERFDIHKKYLEGIDIIYWINLERSTERRDKMETIFTDKQFDNIPKVRINAVDGKTLNLDDYFITKPTIQLTNNQYACLLSHLIAIREFEKTNENVALILEDDMSLDYQEFWNHNIKEIIEQAPSDWEIIKISNIPMNCNENEYEHQNQLFSKNCTASTLAYLINKKGAKKISERWYNNKYDIDLNIIPVADMYIYSVLNTYEYIIPYFTFHDNNDSVLNNVEIGQDLTTDLCKKTVYNKLKQMSSV
jgi:GR25 family glycosyltransferase involved in LPS biosynthesis